MSTLVIVAVDLVLVTVMGSNGNALSTNVITWVGCPKIIDPLDLITWA